SLQMSPIQVEFVDEAVTSPRDIVMLGGVLFRKGDEQVSVEHLNVEWRKALRHVWIGEAVDLFEMGIEDVDGAVVEIRRVKALAIVGLGDRQALVDGACRRVVDRDDRTAGVDGGVPAGNRSVLGREEEKRGCGLAVLGNVKSGPGTVEHLSVRSGGSGLPRRRRNRYGGEHCKRLSRAVLERCQACTIVRYPEWSVRGKRHAPRIDEIRIDVCRSRIAKRDQIGLRIRDQIELRKRRVPVLEMMAEEMTPFLLMVVEVCVHGFLPVGFLD